MIDLQKLISTLEETDQILISLKLSESLAFTGMQTDSRRVEKGNIFLCIAGYQQDGHDFAVQAIERGASLLITQKQLKMNVPQIVVKNSRRVTAILARIFFHDPSSHFTLIGVTGTNGKTSVCRIIDYLLKKEGHKTATIGTLGYTIGEREYPLERTTPDIIRLNEIMKDMLKAETRYVIMEVSSHSLYLDRVFGLHFDIAIFTNLSPEHLDFHRTMDEYAGVKKRLFTYTTDEKGLAIINTDNEWGDKLYSMLSGRKISISSIRGSDYWIEQNITSLEETTFSLHQNERVIQYRSHLPGLYNIFNLSLAIVTLRALGIDIESPDFITLVTEIPPVKGRLERVTEIKDRAVYIDYAHTPDALDKVSETLKEYSDHKLICLFGAGGERDKEKRPLMLKAVLKHSDLVIITSDNPRHENPNIIIQDIIRKNQGINGYWIISDRKKAILQCMNLSSPGDIILIAGKGHEKNQIIGDKILAFDDYQESVLAHQKIKDKKIDNCLDLEIDLNLLIKLYGKELKTDETVLFENISTDSRKIGKKSLFFAFKGENFDGHDYIHQILSDSDNWAVVQTDSGVNLGKTIKVKDTLKAYGDLASKYFSLFSPISIAITGSVGKSTTKEYLNNIISLKHPTLKTFGNENNLIGLPQTLFRIRSHHKYAILELGSNQFGEIRRLAEICQPDIGVITSVGASHLEFFGDEAGVLREKTDLFDQIKNLRFFPGDDSRFANLKGITFGRDKSNNYMISDINSDKNETRFRVNNISYSLPSPYQISANNALIAIAVAIELGFDGNTIQEGLDLPLNIDWRMEIIKSQNKIILADCYNANPDSMQAAITFWNSYYPSRPHVAILGDMLELGSLTEKLHRAIWAHMKGMQYNRFISVGNYSRVYNADQHFSGVNELLASDLISTLPSDAVILIKASHGVSLEKLIGRF